MDERLEKWEGRAALLKSISHPVRLLILESLCEKARCVTDVRELVEISQPNLSQHLTVLKDAGLVESYSNGPLRCYYLIRPTLVRDLLNILEDEHSPVYREREEVIAEVHRPRDGADKAVKAKGA